MLKSFQTSAVVMLVIGATGCLAWLITVEQVAAQLADWSRPWRTSSGCSCLCSTFAFFWWHLHRSRCRPCC